MANIVILGGGFGGVAAAESLAKQIPKGHQITLVSRSPRFMFYPELVRLAFGKCEPDDISFDLREAMIDPGVRFIQAEAPRIKPESRRVVLTHGEVDGELPCRQSSGRGRFWSWAKRVHDKYWLTSHS